MIMMFTMRYLLNLSIIWTHELLREDENTCHYTTAKWTLTALYVGGFFVGTYGVYCDEDHLPGGRIIMTVFQTMWTFFVLWEFRNHEMLSKGGFKQIFHSTKKLALDNEQKEFNHDEMVEDQLKMYILIQLAILFFEALIPLQILFFFFYDLLEEGHAGTLKGECI